MQKIETLTLSGGNMDMSIGMYRSIKDLFFDIRQMLRIVYKIYFRGINKYYRCTIVVIEKMIVGII